MWRVVDIFTCFYDGLFFGCRGVVTKKVELKIGGGLWFNGFGCRCGIGFVDIGGGV
jgi:hypothetical protein